MQDPIERNNKDKGLFIPSRQVSLYVALAVILQVSVFLGGYFLGKTI